MLSWLRKQLAPAKPTAPALVPEFVAPGASEREITAIFISIENYVGIAEVVPLSRLTAFMNDYFERCGDPLHAEGVTIDKYMGDIVVAMAGSPVDQPDHAARACAAVLRIQTAIGDMRLRLGADKDPWPPMVQQFRVRIGLNSGPAIVGNIGSRTRFTYTMTGNTVNLAAQLESEAKQYGARIVCTDATRDQCERTSPGQILFRPLSFSFLKGKLQPTRLFEPMAFDTRATREIRACVEIFSSALEHYERGAWAEAAAGFRESARLERDQTTATAGAPANPSACFLALAEAKLAAPSPATG